MKRMIKMILLLSIHISLLLGLLGCEVTTVEKNQDELLQRITESIQKDNTVDFNEITSFEWDSMYIFGPYTSEQNIKDVLGINTFETYNIQYRDDIELIIFIKDQKMVFSLEYPRSLGELQYERGVKILPENAKLMIHDGELP